MVRRQRICMIRFGALNTKSSRFDATAGKAHAGRDLLRKVGWSSTAAKLPYVRPSKDKIDATTACSAPAAKHVKKVQDIDKVLTNLRFNWIHHPLSHLSLVFTEERSSGLGADVSRAVIVKYTHLLQF